MTKRSDLRGTTETAFAIAGHDCAWVPVRQTVLSGRRDIAQNHAPPNALTSSGLNVTLNASSTDPFRFTIADGWNTNGQRDYVITVVNNGVVAVSSTSGTYGIYLERSPGAIAMNFSSLLPVYQFIAPTSPATGAHWFDLAAWQMKRWTGSAWVATQRLFIGEVTVSGGAIASTITYAYQGRYISDWVAVGANQNYTFNHNLGMSLLEARTTQLAWMNGTATDGGESPVMPLWSNGATTYGAFFRKTSDSRTQAGIGTAAFPYYDGTNWFASGFLKVAVNRGW